MKGEPERGNFYKEFNDHNDLALIDKTKLTHLEKSDTNDMLQSFHKVDFQSLCLLICPPICLSVCLSVCPSIHVSGCPCLPACLPASLPVSLPPCLAAWPCLPACLYSYHPTIMLIVSVVNHFSFPPLDCCTVPVYGTEHSLHVVPGVYNTVLLVILMVNLSEQ